MPFISAQVAPVGILPGSMISYFTRSPDLTTYLHSSSTIFEIAYSLNQNYSL